jgi:hypothetical protein
MLMTFAMPVDPGSVAPDTAWTYDSVCQVLDRTDEVLHASSRNGYLTGAVRPFIARDALHALDFLDSAPWAGSAVAVGRLLQAPELARVVAAVDRVFEVIAAEPESVIAAGVGSCCAEDLQAQAREASVSLDPTIDEGENLTSVFAFLRSLQAMCRRAGEDGRWVLVAQMW